MKPFTMFHKTYYVTALFMSVGMIYPNPHTDRARITFIIFLIVTSLPLCFTMLLDIYNSWLRYDILNIIRHSTVLGPFLGGFFKMLLMFTKRVKAGELIKEFNRDLSLYNDLLAPYKNAARASIRNSNIYSERCWLIAIASCVSLFPLMAVCQMLYSVKDVPTKYMIHDTNKPFSKDLDARFESPYFEFMFVYSLFYSMWYIINFVGYDGFFGLCMNHACLKMKIYCMMLEDAFKLDNISDVRRAIVKVIDEQIRTYKFIGNAQETFNEWLGLIFVATIIQICTCMYQVTEGYSLDVRYMIFMIVSVAHIYVPCRYAAKLKDTSVRTAVDFYCSGWEDLNDQSTRKMIMFMMARAQIPIIMSAFKMIDFDMKLFVSMLQSSYSMFALLKS